MPSSFSTTRAALLCAAFLLSARSFDSARAQLATRSNGTQLKGWRAFSSKEGAFSVRFPAAPKTTARAQGNKKVHVFYHAVPGNAFIVSYADLREGGFSRPQIQRLSAQGMLDSNVQGTLQGSRGVLVSQRRLQWQGFPAREVVYDIPKLGIRAKGIVVYARPFLYQAFALQPKKQAASPATSAKVRAFLDSFQTRTPHM